MAIKTMKSGKYEVRVTRTIKGKLIEVRKRGLLTKGEARFVEQQAKDELALLVQKGWTHKQTWRHALSEYLERNEKRLMYATWLSTKQVLEKHTEKWMNREIDSFNGFEIESHIKATLHNKTEASKHKLLQYIRAVFQDQINRGKLDRNPALGASFKKPPERVPVALTREETLRFFREAYRRNHPWFPVWKLAYATGGRSGELHDLKWEDINFETARITFAHAYCSKLKKSGPTKNKKFRTIPVDAETLRYLTELKKKQLDTIYVLPRIKQWTRGEAAKVLRAFQEEIGIRKTNFHSIRSWFTTHLLEQRVSLTNVKNMLGHAHLSTMERYDRVTGQTLQGATDPISISVEGIEQEPEVITTCY